MLILLGVTVVCIVTAIILVNLIPEDEEVTENKTPLPEIIEGEALQNNYALAYPSIAEKYIKSIQVTNKASYKNDVNEDEAPYTTYTLLRHDIAGGNFVLRYQDKNGKENIYLPDIFSADPSFEYDSLYAVETGDGYGQIHKLTYLLIALELPYFTDRIPLEADGAKKASQLRGFGLDEPQATIKFIHTDKDGNEYQKAIIIGDKNVTGVGYYFMVGEAVANTIEYRPYIYNSLADYYNYAMLGFHSYVNSILVSAGLAEDSSYEPYLTTDYKQWKNFLTDKEGEEVPAGSSAVIYTDIFTPLESKIDKSKYEKDTNRYFLDDELKSTDKYGDAYLTGYIKDGYTEISVDLSEKGAYQKLVNLLVGKKIGTFESDAVVTLTTTKEVELGDKSSVNYKYRIIEIEAIVNDNAEDVVALGAEIDGDDKIKVAYYLYVDGVKVSDVPYHSVIDLGSGNFDAASVAALSELTVGKLDADSYVDLVVDYTEENSLIVTKTFVIDEIVAIYDEKGAEAELVGEKCKVLFRFYYYINNEKQGYDTSYIDFSTDTSDSAKEVYEKIKNLAVGKNLSIPVYTQTAYCEFAEDFITYSIKGVNYFVTSELISAFRFQNNSERDPFYGESIYENMMDNEYSLYAINSSTCEAVAKKLGGIGDTTGSSLGFVGDETVAVGLTPEVMRDYGLYAYTIYFELPRGIIVKDSGDEDTVDDYDQHTKLGFTLYISEETYYAPTDSYVRYVGSDLYDIVARVDASELVFLKYNFVDFWARRSLMMFDIKYLSQMDVEFNMEDLKGSYSFHLPAEGKGNTTFAVRVMPNCTHSESECDCTGNKLFDHIKNYNKNHPDKPIKSVTLTNLYNEYMEKDGDEAYNSKGDVLYSKTSYDSAGVGNFRELMGILYSIPYSGKIEKAEQEAAIKNGQKPLMTISIKLDTELAPTTSENKHVYEFYRCGDRQVMVRLYEQDSRGNKTEAVSDFCISTLAFKKIVASYFTIFNAETIYPDTAYPGLAN